MYTLNDEDKKEGEYMTYCWLGDNSPMLTEQMYTKARSAAEHVFEDYIKASHEVFHFNNTDLDVFECPVSESYILDFYMACKVNSE